MKTLEDKQKMVAYLTVLNNCTNKAIVPVTEEYNKTGILTDEMKAILDIKLTGIGSFTEEKLDDKTKATRPAQIQPRDYTKANAPLIENKD